MAELAAIATKNGGHVLEIGFGMGISAHHIQSHRVYKHFIVEANREVMSEATKFAQAASGLVIPIFGFWEEVVTQFQEGSFDGILYDPYPSHEADFAATRFDFVFEAFRLLRPGGVFTHYTYQEQPGEDYIAMMYQVGFRDVDGYGVDVNPPEDCEYWNKQRILAPIIIK